MFSFFIECKALIKLGLPILLAQLSLVGLGVADTIMSGRVGTEDLAAIGLGSSILLPVFMLSTGILLAITPLVSKALGQKKHLTITHLLHQGFWLALPLGILSLLLLINMDTFLNWLTLEDKVRQLTADYLFYIAFGLPAIAFYQALRFFWEGLSLTVPTMLISFFALFLNIPLNAIFIYGLGPIEAYGAAGCGIASTIVMWVMLFIGIFYVIRTKKTARYVRFSRWKFIFKRAVVKRWSSGKAILNLGVPNTFALLFEVGLFSFIALFIAHLGSVVIASNQVAISLTSLLFMVPLSLSMAITVRVGLRYGQYNFNELNQVIKSGILLAIIFGFLLSVITYVFKENIVQLYSADPAVMLLAVTLITYAVAYQIFDAVQITTAGALRGLHSTKITMVIAFISFWGVGLGVGYLLAFTYLFREPMGVEGYWLAIVMGMFLAMVLLQIALRLKLRQVKAEINHTNE